VSSFHGCLQFACHSLYADNLFCVPGSFSLYSAILQFKGSVKEPNMFHNYETEKITRKASDMAENLQLYQVVRFFHPRSLCTTTHLMLFSEHLPIYESCMTTSSGRTEQHVIIGFGELSVLAHAHLQARVHLMQLIRIRRYSLSILTK